MAAKKIIKSRISTFNIKDIDIERYGIEAEIAEICHLPSADLDSLLTKDLPTLVESLLSLENKGYRPSTPVNVPKNVSKLVSLAIDKSTEITDKVINRLMISNVYESEAKAHDFVDLADSILSNVLPKLIGRYDNTLQVDFVKLIERGCFKTASVFLSVSLSNKVKWAIKEDVLNLLTNISESDFWRQPFSSSAYPHIENMMISAMEHVDFKPLKTKSLTNSLENALCGFASSGHPGMVELLMKYGATIDDFEKNNISRVYFYIENDANERSKLEYALKNFGLPRLPAVELEQYPWINETIRTIDSDALSASASENIINESTSQNYRRKM